MIIHPGLVRFLSGFTFAILVAGCDVAFIGLLDALLPFSLSTIVYQTIFIFLCVIMFPAFCVVECSASNECHDYALYAARGS